MEGKTHKKVLVVDLQGLSMSHSTGSASARSVTGLEDVSVTYRAPYMRSGRLHMEDMFLVPCADAPTSCSSPVSRTEANRGNGVQWVTLVSPLCRPPWKSPAVARDEVADAQAPQHRDATADDDDAVGVARSSPVHVPNWSALLELQELKCATCSQTGIIAARTSASSLRRCTSCSYCPQCHVVVLSMVLDDDPSSRHANSIRLRCTSCHWISPRFPDVASVQRWTKQCAALITTGAGCGASLPLAALQATQPHHGFSISRRVRERVESARGSAGVRDGITETTSVRGAQCVSLDRLLAEESFRVGRFEHVAPSASLVVGATNLQLPQRCKTIAELAASTSAEVAGGGKIAGISTPPSQASPTQSSLSNSRIVSMRGSGLSISGVRPFPWFESSANSAASPTTGPGEPNSGGVAALPPLCAALQPPLHPRFRVVVHQQQLRSADASSPPHPALRGASPESAATASTTGATRRMSFRRVASLHHGSSAAPGSVPVSCTAPLESSTAAGGGEPSVASFTSGLANQALASSLCATRYVPRLTVLANLSRCLKQDLALAAGTGKVGNSAAGMGAALQRRIFLNLHALSSDVGISLINVQLVSSEGCSATVSLPPPDASQQSESTPTDSDPGAASSAALPKSTRTVSRISRRAHHRVPNTVLFADNNAADVLFPESCATAEAATLPSSSDRRTPAASRSDGGLMFGVHLVFPPRHTVTHGTSEEPTGNNQTTENDDNDEDEAPLNSSHVYCWFELALHVVLASPALSTAMVSKFGIPNTDAMHLWFHAIVAFRRPGRPSGTSGQSRCEIK